MNLQIDNILILADDQFAVAEKIQLIKTKLLVKNRDRLIIIISIKFNEGNLILILDDILLNQQRQYKSLRLMSKTTTDLISTRD